MTTLASAVAIGDNHITIDAPLAAGQVPGFVKVGSELLNVGGQDNRLGTTLVLSSPATAIHSQGATVTYAGRPYDAAFLAATAGAGGAGGIIVDNTVDAPEADVTTLIAPGAVLTAGQADFSALEGVQAVSLLGPFPIAHDTVGIEDANDPIELAVLSANTVVITSWLEASENWGTATGVPYMILGIRPDTEDPNVVTPVLEQVGDMNVGSTVTGAPAENSMVGAGTRERWIARAAAASHLVVYVQSDNDGAAPTAGEGDVYALIAVPA